MMKDPFTLLLCHLATGIDVPSKVATNINGRDLPVELELFVGFRHRIGFDVAVLASSSTAGVLKWSTEALFSLGVLMIVRSVLRDEIFDFRR